MANNRVCLCCGNAYEYCGTCRKNVNLPAWKNLFDTENCKDVFQIVSDYEQKAIDKERARKMISACDVTKTFVPKIKKTLEEITAEPKKDIENRIIKKKTVEEKLSD